MLLMQHKGDMSDLDVEASKANLTDLEEAIPILTDHCDRPEFAICFPAPQLPGFIVIDECLRNFFIREFVMAHHFNPGWALIR